MTKIQQEWRKVGLARHLGLSRVTFCTFFFDLSDRHDWEGMPCILDPLSAPPYTHTYGYGWRLWPNHMATFVIASKTHAQSVESEEREILWLSAVLARLPSSNCISWTTKMPVGLHSGLSSVTSSSFAVMLQPWVRRYSNRSSRFVGRKLGTETVLGSSSSSSPLLSRFILKNCEPKPQSCVTGKGGNRHCEKLGLCSRGYLRHR